MRRGTLNLLSSIVFLAVAIVAFYFVWNSAKNRPQDVSSATYITVNVSSITTQVQAFVSSLENNGSLPLGVPTSKMGKENPFSGIETER